MMGFLDHLRTNSSHVIELFIAHAVVVAISVVITMVIGVSVGILVYRTERTANIVLAITSTFLTIPSFALFGIFILIFGLGYLPSIVALVMYGLLPIMRNTVTGLRSVDPAISESAQGMGMGGWRRLWRIDLPLAWPVIVAGVRISTMLLMGIAAIAAIINGPGLGNDIFDGLARMGGAGAFYLVLDGVLGIIILALLFDVFLSLLSWLTTPRGIR